MPSIQRSPLDGRLVVLAPERGKRPGSFAAEQQERTTVPADCPFCPGNEHMTRPTVREALSGGRWINRVVDNMYPAFVRRSESPRGMDGEFAPDDDWSAPAYGMHEVMIVSGDHDQRWATLTEEELEACAEALSDRFQAHRGAGVEYTQFLVNDGRAAGASIEHIHAQLISMPFVVPAVAAEEAQLSSSDCSLCSYGADDERVSPCRIGEVNDWLVVCPMWSATPFELLAFPRQHNWQPTGGGAVPFKNMLQAMRAACAALSETIGDVAFNAVLHVGGCSRPDFHCHLHLWPAIVNTSGFERGTGVYVNVVRPDGAASDLAAVFTP